MIVLNYNINDLCKISVTFKNIVTCILSFVSQYIYIYIYIYDGGFMSGGIDIHQGPVVQS